MEKVILPSEVYPEPGGTAIPVSFHLPVDASETDGSNSSNSIRWLLEADTEVPGVNYKDIFELPVFRTKDTPSVQEAEEFAKSAPASERPAKLSIRLERRLMAAQSSLFPPAAIWSLLLEPRCLP